MKFASRSIFFALFCILTHQQLFAARLVPYRAPTFFEEPRLTKPGLCSTDIFLGGGGTGKGFNSDGDEVELLNIYGNENFRYIGKGVPTAILNKNSGGIINDLWQKNMSNDFGEVKIGGRIKFAELNFNLVKNWNNGFSFHANIPFQRITIQDLDFKDLSKDADKGSVNYNTWKSFINSINSEMNKYDICLERYKERFLGDITLEMAWSQSKRDTTYFDFMDTTIKGGIIIPASPDVCYERPLLIGAGYRKHFGFPFSFDMSFGLYEWITVGGHLGCVLFLDKNRNVGMKTAPEQSGLIKLARGNAKVEYGNIWEVGSFIKADHMPWGFSLTLGYSFATQHKTKLIPDDQTTFDCPTVNGDKALHGWSMHTINIHFEYDFAVERHMNLPRVGLNFDIPVKGKQIFKTDMFVGKLGIEFDW